MGFMDRVISLHLVVEYCRVIVGILAFSCSFTDTHVLSNPLAHVAGSDTHIIILANDTLVVIADKGLKLVGYPVLEREKGSDGLLVGEDVTDVQLWECW